jgi:hypothetical protein
VLRSSELWVGIAAALGQLGVVFGWWSQDHFNNVLLPAIVYVIGRVTSKVAKAV